MKTTMNNKRKGNKEMKTTENSKRKGLISLLKFGFSILIILYHISRILTGTYKYTFCLSGYLVVDFFFMVSGYFFYKSVLKIKENVYEENVKSTIKRIIKFIPYTIIIGSIAIVFNYFTHTMIKREIFMSMYNIFLLDIAGVSGYQLNGVTWYLSSMIIVFFILTPIICKKKEAYTHYICPLIILIGLGYLYNMAPSLNVFMTFWNGFFYGGLVRALVDINLGILVYLISNCLLSKSKDIKRYNLKVNVVGLILYSVVLAYVFLNQDEGSMDYFIIIVLFLAAITSFSETKLNEILDNGVVRYLEKISLPLYINQFVALNIVNYINKTHSNTFTNNIFIFLGMLVSFSIIEEFAIDKIKMLIAKKSNNKKIKQ